jgi:hypothetical protein
VMVPQLDLLPTLLAVQILPGSTKHMYGLIPAVLDCMVLWKRRYQVTLTTLCTIVHLPSASCDTNEKIME